MNQSEAAAAEKARSAAAAAPAPSGPRDNLASIRGMDPYTAQRLQDRGVTTFAAVAALTDDDVAAIEEDFGIPGNFDRFSWRYQAQQLAEG